MTPSETWAILGLGVTDDKILIRRAYARRLKVTNPEDDPEGFQRLRKAYECALGGVAGARRGVGELKPASPQSPPAVPRSVTSVPLSTSAPPHRPTDPRAAHAALFDRLETLLGSEADPDPGMLSEAVSDLLASPAMEDIGIQSRTEERLAEMLVRVAPRGDPVIVEAATRLGWDRMNRGHGADPWIERAAIRARGLESLERLSRSSGARGRAVTALKQPLTTWRRLANMLSPGLEEAVRGLLKNIPKDRTLRDRFLDESTVAYWETRLDRPHLGARALWAVIGATVLAAFIEPGSGGLAARLSWLLAPSLLAIAWLFGVAWPRHLLMRRGIAKAPTAARLGWAVAFGPFAIAVTFAPDTPLALMGTAAGGALLCLWAFLTGQPTKGPSRWRWQARALLGQVFLLVWWGVTATSLPSDEAVRFSIVILSCAIISGVGAGSIQTFLVPGSLRSNLLIRLYYTVLTVSFYPHSGLLEGLLPRNSLFPLLTLLAFYGRPIAAFSDIRREPLDIVVSPAWLITMIALGGTGGRYGVEAAGWAFLSMLLYQSYYGPIEWAIQKLRRKPRP